MYHANDATRTETGKAQPVEQQGTTNFGSQPNTILNAAQPVVTLDETTEGINFSCTQKASWLYVLDAFSRAP